MPTIHHVAIWVNDLELMRAFYTRYFSGKAGQKYENPGKGFSSYMLSFDDGCKLEIMYRTGMNDIDHGEEDQLGWAHIAIGVGSRELVVAMTNSLRKDGYRITGEPRVTGDGFFESVVIDPEGNRIEITV